MSVSCWWSTIESVLRVSPRSVTPAQSRLCCLLAIMVVVVLAYTSGFLAVQLKMLRQSEDLCQKLLFQAERNL